MNTQQVLSLIDDFAEKSKQIDFDRAAWEVKNGLATAELAVQTDWNKGYLPSELDL